MRKCKTSGSLKSLPSCVPQLVVVQSLSHFFVTPWIVARQTSLSFTISWSLLKLMSIESVMPSNRLVLYHPLLFLPSIFLSIRVFFQWVSSSQQVAQWSGAKSCLLIHKEWQIAASCIPPAPQQSLWLGWRWQHLLDLSFGSHHSLLEARHHLWLWYFLFIDMAGDSFISQLLYERNTWSISKTGS